MVDIRSKQCENIDCYIIARYNFRESKGLRFCKSHSLPGMVDIKNPTCETCQTSFANPKYKPNCARCHFYLHPDDERIANYKTREHSFMMPLSEVYPDMILDKIVSGGCSKRRPDGLIDCHTHSIIVEIDEDQHVGYDDTCENKRTMELFQDLGNRPLMVIRLNPDGYTNSSGKRINPVFGMRGGSYKKNNAEFKRRYDRLLAEIQSAISVVPEKDLSIVKLFFSE